ncbi:phosphatase PAP2 family protein [Nonomuraea sp. NPDC050790]|uniref:phosphatase PAP2 family protein n=1 Tax=Nonomuraea sp. NPDC050790 TaxID=3364371 RepID=UPI0037BA76FD
MREVLARLWPAVVWLLLMTAATFALGELVERSARMEPGVMADIASERLPYLNWLSDLGSKLSDTPVIVVLTALAAIGFRLALGRWRESVFLVAAVWSQSLVFLATSALVARRRPPVTHLDAAPPTSSWPSGHVSAAVCFYGGLAILLVAHLHGHRVLSGLVWAVGLGVPMIVAASRIYRGMHFVTDVVWGLVLGVFCLAVMIRAVLR